MVQEDGSLILIDFGSSSLKGVTQTTYNPAYAPIEQIDGTSTAGSWMDVYALSATLYYLFCSETPPDSLTRENYDTIKTLQERNIPIKKFQAQAIIDGLAVHQEDRIQSMEIFYSRLYNILTKEEKIRRYKLIIRAIFAAALSLTAGILITLNFSYGLYLGDGLRFSLLGDGFHVRGFSYDREKILIPSKKFGMNIVQIDKGAFQGSKFLQNVSIPGTINTIGEFAFNDCVNLMTVKINEGVQKISSQAFANCQKLQAVITPGTVKSISSDAFMNSQNHILLIKNLESQAALIAKNLNLNYASIETSKNEIGITLSKYDTEQLSIKFPDFIDGLPVTEISSGIISKSIFPREFSGIIQSVKLPAKLERIGDYALYNLPFMNKINLPETLKSIGKHAFESSYITEINLPESVTFVGEHAFSLCADLSKAKLSPNMKEIPNNCFAGDINLTEVIIPEV